MAAANALMLVDDSVIRERLLMRISTTRGEAPLKKLTKKFFAFVAEVEKRDGEGEDGTERLTAIEKHYGGFMQELLAWEAPARKSRLAIAAYRHEQQKDKDKERQLKRQCAEVRAAIEDHRRELIEAREERAHHNKCESVRAVIDKLPSRAESRRAAAALQREAADLEAAREQARRTLALRRKQFSQLVQVLDELQEDLEDESSLAITVGEDAHRDGRTAKSSGASGSGGETDAAKESEDQNGPKGAEITVSDVAPTGDAKVDANLGGGEREGEGATAKVENVDEMEVDAA